MGLTGGPGGPGGPFGPSRPRGPCKRKEKEGSDSAQGPGPLPYSRQIVQPRSAPLIPEAAAAGLQAAQGVWPTRPFPLLHLLSPPHLSTSALGSAGRVPGIDEGVRQEIKGCPRERRAFQLNGCPFTFAQGG